MIFRQTTNVTQPRLLNDFQEGPSPTSTPFRLHRLSFIDIFFYFMNLNLYKCTLHFYPDDRASLLTNKITGAAICTFDGVNGKVIGLLQCVSASLNRKPEGRKVCSE